MRLLLTMGLIGAAGYVAYWLQRQHQESVTPLNTRRHMQAVLEQETRWSGTRWERVS
jgi:ketopantoate reductase